MHGKQLEETHELAHDIPGVPLHGDVPDGVQGHHHKGHHQVGRGQAANQRPKVGRETAPSPAGDADEHGEVADGGEDKQHQGGRDPELGGDREGGGLPVQRRWEGGGITKGRQEGVVFWWGCWVRPQNRHISLHPVEQKVWQGQQK